jgi:hypothetical protein
MFCDLVDSIGIAARLDPNGRSSEAAGSGARQLNAPAGR